MKESIIEATADDEDDDIDSEQDEELTLHGMKEALSTIEKTLPTTTATPTTAADGKGEKEKGGNGSIIEPPPSSKLPDELLCQADRTAIPDASSSIVEGTHEMPSLVAWSNNSSHSIRSTSSELSMPSLVSWADGSFRNSTAGSVGTSLGGSSIATSGGGGGGTDISVVSAVSTAALSVRTFSDGESLDTIGPLLNDTRPALPLKKLKPDVIRVQKEGRWQSGGDDDKKEVTTSCARSSDTTPLPPAAPKR